MKRIDRALAVLLLTAGCASVSHEAPAGAPGSAPVPDEATASDEVEDTDDEADADSDPGGDLRNWIPDIFRDLWDTIDADIGTGYGFGLHLQATNFVRLGVFDHSDFALFGLEADTLEAGRWHCPFAPEGADEGDLNPIFDLGATLGVGWGASFVVHPYEIADALTTIVGLGYWSLEDD